MNPAEVLKTNGNYAVVQLPGRAFPAIAIQGDTFHALVHDLRKSLDPGNSDRRPMTEGVLARLELAIKLYKDAQQERGGGLPWVEHQ